MTINKNMSFTMPRFITKHDTVIPMNTVPFCMAADAQHVYLFGQFLILIYTIKSNSWEKMDFVDIDVTTCSVNNEETIIYIFGHTHLFDQDIIKYYIESRYIDYLESNSLCADSNGNAISITAPNDKIYLHGCSIASFKTLIFDIKSEQFALETIDIDVPMPQNIPDYRYFSRMSIYDDNVLLFMHSTDYTYPKYYPSVELPSHFLYFAVTNEISINVMQTHKTMVWPLDGFLIKYYVNDFTFNATGIYYIHLRCYDTTTPIHSLIMLNTSNDNCICNESVYKCYGCKQHFNMSLHLT
eukprot:96992_1